MHFLSGVDSHCLAVAFALQAGLFLVDRAGDIDGEDEEEIDISGRAGRAGECQRGACRQ